MKKFEYKVFFFKVGIFNSDKKFRAVQANKVSPYANTP